MVEKLVVEWLAGMCPLQGQGTLNDRWNWYFRARHDKWELILEAVGVDPLTHYFDPEQALFFVQQPYGPPGGHQAGYMEPHEAVSFIWLACEQFLAEQKEQAHE